MRTVINGPVVPLYCVKSKAGREIKQSMGPHIVLATVAFGSIIETHIARNSLCGGQ